jgi:exosortase D (VPLPA-CTERM-specific)
MIPNSTVNRLSTKMLCGLLVISCAALAYIFRNSLEFMEQKWAVKEEYSHGYMIPVVALFLLWRAAPDLRRMDWQASWLSPVLMLLALAGWMLGELSSLFIISNYSAWLALCALALATLGWQGTTRIWAALVYMVFTIPLPNFLYNNLSAKLQLISTEIGESVIRLFGISVFVEGNVIDLGTYQLQVVDACSGLRYLFPLMSFGFLIAVLYTGPRWHRWLIFLATVPVTVLMNSVRIGMIGISVEYWGIEMAEGVLHTFEGWFVFMACLLVLVLLMWLLNVPNKDGLGLLDRIDLSYPTWREITGTAAGTRQTLPTLILCTLLCALAVPLSLSVDEREELIPERDTFVQFPLIKNGWVGREGTIAAPVLETLNLTDYAMVDYQQADDPKSVNFYVAYYASQRAGASIHSPRSCIPGGGWEITQLGQLDLSSVLGMQGPNVNRVIIRLGEQKQLVYYWFEQRGRSFTNEYLAKWYLFQDSLTMNRSDGALVRLVTSVPPNTDEALADKRLQNFLKDFYPDFPRYLPGAPDGS